MGYPCIRYSATDGERRVLTERDEIALGAGWYDSPKKAKAAQAQAVDDAPEPKRRRSKASEAVQ